MDGSKSCTFVTLKYLLIVILSVDLINLIVAIPNQMSTLDELEAKVNNEDNEKRKNELQDEINSRRLFIIATLGSNIIFVVLGLVGVSKENFCLSLSTAILMTLETIVNSFSGLKTASSIMSLVFNVIITIFAYAFAFMCKSFSINLFNSAQVIPLTHQNSTDTTNSTQVTSNDNQRRQQASNNSTNQPQPQIINPSDPPSVDNSSNGLVAVQT